MRPMKYDQRFTVVCRNIRLIAIDYTESAVRGRNMRGFFEDGHIQKLETTRSTVVGKRSGMGSLQATGCGSIAALVGFKP